MNVKASTLAIPIVIYGVLGALLALATDDDTQVYVVIATGALLAFSFGGAWPVHRAFPIAGMAFGVALSVGLYSTMLANIDDPEFSRADERWFSFVISLALLGAWTPCMAIGAVAGWLAQRILRPQIAEGQA